MVLGFKGKRPGFTLVEILAVVILIGILFSISFQSFASARDRSANAQVDGNIRSIQQALVTFEADTERFPDALVPTSANDDPILAGNPQVLLDPELDRRYLPGNALPRTAWTECWQSNNLNLPAYDAAKAIWPIADEETVTDRVKLPPNPENLVENGSLPDNTGAPRPLVFTRGTFGAVLYEANGPARNRYMLVGVGKNLGAARVVALSTNAN